MEPTTDARRPAFALLAGDESRMVWLGLLQTIRRELPHVGGYHRVAVPSGPECWRRVPVGPPTLVNLVTVSWPNPEQPWGWVRGYAVFGSDDPNEAPAFAYPWPEYGPLLCDGTFTVVCEAGTLEIDPEAVA